MAPANTLPHNSLFDKQLKFEISERFKFELVSRLIFSESLLGLWQLYKAF